MKFLGKYVNEEEKRVKFEDERKDGKEGNKRGRKRRVKRKKEKTPESIRKRKGKMIIEEEEDK